MTPESDSTAGRLAVQWIEAWQRMDIDWLRKTLTDEFVHESPFGRFEGRDRYLEAVEPMARKSVMKLEVLDVVAQAHRAVVRFENQTPQGVVETCDWVRVEAGRIVEIRSFYDTASVREVLSSDEQQRLDGRSHD